MNHGNLNLAGLQNEPDPEPRKQTNKFKFSDNCQRARFKGGTHVTSALGGDFAFSRAARPGRANKNGNERGAERL